MKRLLLSTLLLVAAAPGASAADLLTLPDEIGAHDWTGPYAGFQLGYGAFTALSAGTPIGLTDTVPMSGAIMGFDVGTNAQYGAWVLGLEGNLDWSGVNGSITCLALPASSCAGKIDWLGAARFRAGYAMDQTLLYATGGLAVGGGSAMVDPPEGGSTGSYSDVFMGWTVGAGVEFAVAENVSLKAEYDYYDLGHRTAPLGTVSTANTYDLSATGQALEVGVNFSY